MVVVIFKSRLKDGFDSNPLLSDLATKKEEPAISMLELNLGKKSQNLFN